MNNEYLTATEASEILGMTPKQVANACGSGKIPAVLERRYPARTRQFWILRADAERIAAQFEEERQDRGDYVTIDEAMEITGLTINALRYRCQEKIYTAKKSKRGQWLILRSDVHPTQPRPYHIREKEKTKPVEEVFGDFEPMHGPPMEEVTFMAWYHQRHAQPRRKVIGHMPMAIARVKIDHHGRVRVECITRRYEMVQTWYDADHW